MILIIPKQFFHVILGITNEYGVCNFRESNSRKIVSCNWNVFYREINSENKVYVCNIFGLECSQFETSHAGQQCTNFLSSGRRAKQHSATSVARGQKKHINFVNINFLPPAQIRSHPCKPNQRKASSWTFPRGIPEQKCDVNRACFPKEKHQISQKWAKFMNFSFWPFLWFGLLGQLLTKNPHFGAPGKKFIQEDVNGEKLTVKKWWIFGPNFHGLRRVFHGL